VISKDASEMQGDGARGLLVLLLVSVGAGALAGAVISCFRLLIQESARLWLWLLSGAVGGVWTGRGLLLAGAFGATALAARMVQRYANEASGSGIPQVEASAEGLYKHGGMESLLVKFAGGALALGSGLALGREGPSVQMSAVIGREVGKLLRLPEEDLRLLLVSGAGAGLSAAFNAAGVGPLFVMEELLKRFSMRVVIATLGCSASAVAVQRVIMGPAPIFQVQDVPHHGLIELPGFLLVGLAAGIAGVGYNKLIMGALSFGDRFSRSSAVLRAGLVGALSAVLACFSPLFIFGGESQVQATMDGMGAVIALAPLLFVVRFCFGPISYAAGTPGGLFAPMLALGCWIGLGVSTALNFAAPSLAPPAISCEIVGMAAFFTASVRAPLTGIVLVMEMTGVSALFLPMVAGCFPAMAVPYALKGEPIYDDLKRRLLAGNSALPKAVE
jgi:chloride channel protein, CIC family